MSLRHELTAMSRRVAARVSADAGLPYGDAAAMVARALRRHVGADGERDRGAWTDDQLGRAIRAAGALVAASPATLGRWVQVQLERVAEGADQ